MKLTFGRLLKLNPITILVIPTKRLNILETKFILHHPPNSETPHLIPTSSTLYQIDSIHLPI